MKISQRLPVHVLVLALAVVLAALHAQWATAAVVVDFEDLTTFTGTSGAQDGQPGGQFYNGNNGSNMSNNQGWSSRGVQFGNSYTYVVDPMFGDYDFWSGWSYSSVVNTISPGFFNQYAAVSGGGSSGGIVSPGNLYAVAFTGSGINGDGTPANGSTVNFATSTEVASVDVTNTTYAVRYLRDGLDGFGSPDMDPTIQFGTGDFLRLHITGFDGIDGTGSVVGSTTFDLANYGADGTADDVVVDTWRTVDLSGFASMRSLNFAITSSQVGAFGIDTPTYFAIDNLTFTAVPEPSGMAFVALLAGPSTLRRRCRR